MTQMWLAILVVAAAAYGLKLAGFVLPEAILNHPTVVRAAAIIPIALLSALLWIQVFGADRAVVLDARVVGVAVAALALWLRVPFLVVVLLAALAAAAIRAMGFG